MEQILTAVGYGIIGMLVIFFLWTLRGGLLFLFLFFTLMWAVQDLNAVAQFASYFLGVPLSLIIALLFDEITEYAVDTYIKRPNEYK
jgi:hypothetical protein